jgi:sigma-70-like protein
VLVLRYYGGLSEAEIAEAAGISPGTVKSTASRGVGLAGVDRPAGRRGYAAAAVRGLADGLRGRPVREIEALLGQVWPPLGCHVPRPLTAPSR